MSSSRSSKEPSSSSGGGGGSSRGTSDRREAPPFPSNVAIVSSETAFGTFKTETVWPEPEFRLARERTSQLINLDVPGTQGERTEIKNVNGKTCRGTILAAGTMLPLGMAIPSETVLPYGMYLPPGTMLPDGALVPIHTRMVSVVPLPTKKKERGEPEDVWCVVM
ncbi:hypothetical protein QFC21_004001 [Naganishia friedmannii]|uniref:Uncharacterized protein n=1 Tax=Naganishia friedmannii TaxID=89922 RepID=A0ACC2VKQ1_9TREE|nr:hypothetical protein QFC21_004001 [Naganishia friedmannii]